jgi:hypothetical protein
MFNIKSNTFFIVFCGLLCGVCCVDAMQKNQTPSSPSSLSTTQASEKSALKYFLKGYGNQELTSFEDIKRQKREEHFKNKKTPKLLELLGNLFNPCTDVSEQVQEALLPNNIQGLSAKEKRILSREDKKMRKIKKSTLPKN